MAMESGSIDFGFGGRQQGEAIVSVPFSEMIVPIYTDKDQLLLLPNGRPACRLGVEPASGVPGDHYAILGNTFLRSAYVVFDIDHKQVAIAPARCGVEDSHVVAITNNKVLAKHAKAQSFTITAAKNTAYNSHE